MKEKDFVVEDVSATERKEIRKNNRTALISVGIALIILASFFLGFFVHGETEPVSGKKLTEIVKIIDGASVYADGKNADELAELFRKIVLTDDAYAKYHTPEEYKKMLAEDAGNYSGVGIAIDENGVIKYVYRNSPAHRGGVKAGDKLTAGIFVGEEEYKLFTDALNEYNADKEDKDKKIIQQIYNDFFAGYNVGETVRFKVDRAGAETEFSIVKEDYVVSYVEYADDGKSYYFSTEEDGFHGRESDENFIEGLSADTAYIKLYEFQGGAAAQFAQALSFMQSRGKTKLILDLRDNGGGLITVLLDIASYLINDNGAAGLKVLGVKEKNNTTAFFTAENRFTATLTDISVIANAGTASASECLIGALIAYGNAERNGARFDYDRLILTRKHETRDIYCTFGKGIMQTTYGLRTGGALTLTTAYIYWPEPFNDVCIHDKGITTEVEENCVSDAAAIARADAVLR